MQPVQQKEIHPMSRFDSQIERQQVADFIAKLGHDLASVTGMTFSPDEVRVSVMLRDEQGAPLRTAAGKAITVTYYHEIVGDVVVYKHPCSNVSITVTSGTDAQDAAAEAAEAMRRHQMKGARA